MSLGLREDRRRRRRQFRWATLRWLFALACIGAAGMYAYETGNRLAERNVVALKQQIADLSRKVGDLETQANEQTNEVSAERARAAEWQQRYERDVATGDIKRLFDLLRSKLDQGVSAERLRFVVEQTEDRRDCDSPQNRKLIVQTPLSGGDRSQASFANGAITVAVSGVPARNTNGNPEAWYDVTRPVTVRLTRPGGKATDASGTLPLHPAVVHGDREYRFSVVPGARGIAEIAMERCRFP